MKYNQNNYAYQSLGYFYSVEHDVVFDVLYKLKLLDMRSVNADTIKEQVPSSIFYHKRRWILKYVSCNTDNLSIYYVDMFKEKLLRISNHWSYVSFTDTCSTKMWIRGCWWELHGKRATKAFHLPKYNAFYGGQIEFSKLQPTHK